MHKIALDTVKSLANYLTMKGIDRKLILSKINLTETQLNQSNQLINTTIYEDLYKIANDKLTIKNIGFEFGQLITPDRWSILGYIVYTSPTLKNALINQRKYQTLVGNLGTPLQEYQQDFVVLKWLPAYHCSMQTVEEIITGWAAMAQNLSNNYIYPYEVYFTHHCLTNIAQYERFFNCSVKFNHEFNGIKVKQSILTVPLNKYDPVMHDLCVAQADKVLNNLVSQLPIDIVSQFIQNQLPQGIPEIEYAAQALQMSVRTLQRKLNEHQLTFSGLVDSIRKDLAVSYLTQTNTKILYITQMLGFSEQSAFQRAFKRWTQQTPKQYRDSANTKLTN
ncbi:MAG: AraC family transcriptional regulator ligand-binding domain-containing protein [Alteromonadaceae bacterium]|nr:AraC family transcriptional regulator ligand-binding domain-containing protein [Alteromonadaceae bacterium]